MIKFGNFILTFTLKKLPVNVSIYVNIEYKKIGFSCKNCQDSVGKETRKQVLTNPIIERVIIMEVKKGPDVGKINK